MLTKHGSKVARWFGLALLAGVCVVPLSGCAGESPDAFLGGIVKPFTAPTPQQAARNAFNVYDADKRRQAVDLLAAAPFGGQPVYLKMYRLLLTDPDATVRASCASALGRHGDVNDATLIAPLLQDKSEFVRWNAARALQRIHNPAVVGALIDAMGNDTEANVRMAAALALGQYPSSTVVQALIGGLNDTDFGVVYAAEQSLMTLTGQDIPADPGAWLKWTDANAGSLFAGQKKYTFQPYAGPQGFLSKLEFWRDHPKPAPQTPAGLDG